MFVDLFVRIHVGSKIKSIVDQLYFITVSVYMLTMQCGERSGNTWCMMH